MKSFLVLFFKKELLSYLDTGGTPSKRLSGSLGQKRRGPSREQAGQVGVDVAAAGAEDFGQGFGGGGHARGVTGDADAGQGGGDCRGHWRGLGEIGRASCRERV